MNATYSFKNKVTKIIDLQDSKVWLSTKQGRRIECLFTLGTEQFSDSIVIYEDDKYVLRGQNISKILKDRILDEVNFSE